MELQETTILANKLLRKHGLTQKGWIFQFDNSLKRFGVCRYRSRIIGMSKKLTLLNNVIEVKDTILHEIAHAIAGHKAGHGEEWKEICIEIGARPNRCYSSDEIVTPELKYFAVCGSCKTIHQKSKIIKRNYRRACLCQSHLPWDKKTLLTFKKRW
jgi:predicted SprT family Zn-dependent metalloprotease